MPIDATAREAAAPAPPASGSVAIAGGGGTAFGGAGADPGEAFESFVTAVIDLYRQAGRSMRSSDPADWGANVTMPQFRALFYLGRAGPASVGEVAAAAGVSQPSATETLDKLVRAGLVARAPDPNDRRVVLNVLTPAGREEIDRPWEARRAVLASALRAASPKEREAIERGLTVLCSVLGRSDEERDVAARPARAGERRCRAAVSGTQRAGNRAAEREPADGEPWRDGLPETASSDLEKERSRK